MSENPEFLETLERGNNFTWPDLLGLDQQNFGLRHVSSKNKAEAEVRGGIEHGDGLAISAVSSFLVNKEGINPQIKGKLQMILKLNIVGGILSEKEKEEAVKGYNQAIRGFVKESIGTDINRFFQEGDRVGQVLEKMSKGPSFLLANFQGASNPYDLERYYGLGKCGKQRVAPEKIRGVVYPDEEQMRGLAGESERKKIIGQEEWERLREVLSQHYFERIVSLARSQLIF